MKYFAALSMEGGPVMDNPGVVWSAETPMPPAVCEASKRMG